MKPSGVKAEGFNGELLLAPGAGDHLLRSAPLLRPLVQSAWAITVARFNTLGQARLQEFLFGAERVSLALVSSDLLLSGREVPSGPLLVTLLLAQHGEAVRGSTPLHARRCVPSARARQEAARLFARC